ncbi:50S ribosomal protein L11 methyltransferase [Eubacteriales bacterium OttesenSCG-928-K08]|nr:50S ribosomal protein L11 methyltransferase [Eubacteriales bacterium OttesenSCG-928-K08]
MEWIEFAVYTTDQGIEAVCDALASVGLEQVSIEESSDRVEEHLRELAPYWDYADAVALSGQKGPCVKAYIADLPGNANLLADARRAVDSLFSREGEPMGELRIEETRVCDEDWANSWKKHYKPMPVGKRLLVCPSWEVSSLLSEQVQGREVIKLDPGMVFGTGAHHTTRLCLELIDQQIKGGEAVLDIGCGSGILAIAALLLGAKSAVLVDIDPVAKRVVRENCEMNGIDPGRVAVFTGDILRDKHLQREVSGQYDMVFANIVADVIIPLCGPVREHIKSGGAFICSGIIDERAAEVEQALFGAGYAVEQMYRAADEGVGGPATGWRAYLAR